MAAMYGLRLVTDEKPADQDVKTFGNEKLFNSSSLPVETQRKVAQEDLNGYLVQAVRYLFLVDICQV
jgi:hypothetical protein